MIEMNQLVENLRERPEFEEFRKYVIAEIEKLNSVEGLGKMSNELAGETAKVRLLTAQALYAIISPFIHVREKKVYTQEDFDNAAARKGL